MSAIEVDALTKRYGAHIAVDEVSFRVEPGEVFALLGPNGAGKTTTVEILEGLRSRDGGHVRVLGTDPGRNAKTVADRVGVMPQEAGLPAGIRVAEAMRLYAAMYPQPADVTSLMERLGLGPHARTTWRRLSGGLRQRLSLALALVGRPDVAFLDEPTASMDAHARADTWDLVRELREGGACIVLTTHLIDEAERTADRVAIVHHGRVLASGPPSELIAGHRAREIRIVTDASFDHDALGSHVGVGIEPEVSSPGLKAYRTTGADPTPALVARIATWLAERGVLAREITIGRRTLNDVFMELTREP